MINFYAVCLQVSHLWSLAGHVNGSFYTLTFHEMVFQRPGVSVYQKVRATASFLFTLLKERLVYKRARSKEARKLLHRTIG